MQCVLPKSLPTFNVVSNPFHVQCNDGLLPLLGFEESQRDLRIHEPVFSEDCRTVGVLQDVERLFKVRISVAVVGTEPVAGKVSLGGFVQAGGQLVGLSVPGESVGAPARGTVPHSAAAGCIDVDADDKGVVGFVTVANGYTVDASAALLQGDVFVFGHEEGCIIAPGAGDAQRRCTRASSCLLGKVKMLALIIYLAQNSHIFR